MSKILIAEKMRFYPNKKQIHIIETTFGATRRMYNCLHAQFIERSKLSVNEKKLHKYKNYTAMKNTWNNDGDWIKYVGMQALSNAEINYKQAWDNYRNNKAHFNIPTFKSKHKARKTYSLNRNTKKNDIRIHSNNFKLLKVPKLGSVKLSKKIRFDEYLINKITISKTPSNKYFISILMEIEEDQLKYNNMKINTSKKIGIDLGLTDIITDSDGNKITNPKHFKKHKDRLTIEQRSLARKYEQAKKDGRKLSESKNYQKQKLKVAKIHEKIKNQRTDFLHKLSNTITNESQIIVVEDLKIENMVKNGRLSGAISDVAWGTFVSQLEYKSRWKGRTFVKVGTFFPSTKLCSVCGENHKDIVNSLSVREWQCPDCDTYHDRDINAAINILNEGLKLI